MNGNILTFQAWALSHSTISPEVKGFFIGGSGWESNPPLALGKSLVLKTREVTRLLSPPIYGVRVKIL